MNTLGHVEFFNAGMGFVISPPQIQWLTFFMANRIMSDSGSGGLLKIRSFCFSCFCLFVFFNGGRDDVLQIKAV